MHPPLAPSNLAGTNLAEFLHIVMALKLTELPTAVKEKRAE
jgi:hypothetical protein